MFKGKGGRVERAQDQELEDLGLNPISPTISHL